MRKDILIFGAGGFAREVLWTIEDSNHNRNEWNIIGFLDDDKTKWGKEVNGYPVYDPRPFINNEKGFFYLSNGIGNCYTKYLIQQRFAKSNCSFANLVHPSVIFNRTAQLDGEGIIVQAGTIITPGVVIKSHVTINIDVTVGHDCVVQDFVTIAPGVHLSGYVTVGKGSDIGTGAVVIQGLTIGNECIIGANASVIRDIPDYSVAVGVPAKVIKTHEEKIILRQGE